MVLKSSSDHIAGIALLRDLEEQYGSVANVPDDNKQLMRVRKMLDKDGKVFSATIPHIVMLDKKAKPLTVFNLRYEEAYEAMLRDNLTRVEACKVAGIKTNSFYTFLSGIYTEYFEMECRGRYIKGRTVNDVLNEAKKMGLNYRTENAVENHELHKRIVLRPLIFHKRAALKSR